MCEAGGTKGVKHTQPRVTKGGHEGGVLRAHGAWPEAR